jgi:hypothetical protein
LSVVAIEMSMLACLECVSAYVSADTRAKSIVLDFGANQGEFSHAIIEHFGSRVFAVEPPDLACSIRPHPNLFLPLSSEIERGLEKCSQKI